MALNPSKDYVSHDKCNMEDPQEHFLWALMQIQIGTEMMPILENTARSMSKHLHELGFRHHPELQKKKFQRAYRGQPNRLNGAARWVDINAKEPEPIQAPNVGAMTHHEQQWLVEELKRHGAIIEPAPELKSVAQVADWAPNEVEKRVKRTTTAEERGIT